MDVDLSVIRVALIVIAASAVVQTLALGGGIWMLLKAVREGRMEVERRLDRFQADVSSTSTAARRMAATVEGFTGRASSLLDQGARVAGAVSAFARPPWWLAAGAITRLITGRRGQRQTPTT